ncbi:hypothetical protein IV203_020746 [Nitzschia inconspicua]|uniref:Uncharacterized protein n=1 Tax=Nitzschia inconspicua TaxID=303405 RepID=A0A9K3KFY8_9STRA|nr:hypothetical protein IV203_021562 [Nitzschia inconspicua]KAG7342802.1 hypothetical protein IV203_020746 [Nitzschia inconspicua]
MTKENSTSIEPIVTLNNYAGTLLSTGEYEAALAIFRYALLKTEDILIQDKNEIGNDMPAVYEKATSYSKSTASKLPSLPLSRPSQTSVEHDENTDTEFIYRTPIHITKRNVDERDCNEPELHSILLFNVALSYHLWALEGDDSASSKKQQLLKKALKLYECSFSMQIDSWSMSITSLLALVNNCASIYKLLKNTKRAETFYNHMLSTLMAMIEIGEASEVEQLEGFLYNASRLILRDVVAPAA